MVMSTWYIASDSLSHYGVKGMKWGVRRERSTNHSKEARNKKVKTALKIAAVAVGASVAGYCLYKYGNKNFDKVIKSGTNIQHMSRYTNELLDKPFYASHLKIDNKSYAKDIFIGGTQWKTKMTLQSSKNLRIAGKKNSERIYKQWLTSNPEAAARFGKQSYFSFNRNLNSPDYRDKKLFDSFYNELKKNGYDAIRDVNDQSQSGMTSPIIIFGSLKDIKVKDITGK